MPILCSSQFSQTFFSLLCFTGVVFLEFSNANSTIFHQNRTVTYQVKAKGVTEDFDAPYEPKSTAEIAYQQLQDGLITQAEFDAVMQGEKVFQTDRAQQKRRRKNYMISVEDVAFQQLLEGQINQAECVAKQHDTKWIG